MSIIARTTVYFMYKIVPYLNKIAHIQNLCFSLITVTNSETYPTFFLPQQNRGPYKKWTEIMTAMTDQ